MELGRKARLVGGSGKILISESLAAFALQSALSASGSMLIDSCPHLAGLRLLRAGRVAE